MLDPCANMDMAQSMKARYALIGLFALAITERLLALFQPYHQDEYKWAIEVDPATGLSNPVHPPLAEYTYRLAGAMVGYAHLRIVSIVLSLLTLALLYYLARRWWGTGTALVIAAVYVIDFFALLASVQIDIDGAFLPIAALISFALYFEWVKAEGRRKRALAIGLAVSLVAGFALKLSFVLVPVTLFVHALLTDKGLVRGMWQRKEVRIGFALFTFILVAVLALVWENIPFLHYVDKFVAFRGRDIGELAFLSVKGVLYLSPLIVFGLLLGSRYLRKLDVWFLFLAANMLFYYVLFDFTHTSFDRYLMFLILPGSIITGFALHELLRAERRRFYWYAGILTAALLVVAHAVFALPHRVIPLIPKTAFVEAFRSLHWNFLIPFTGGSGPLGFYMPVDGLAVLWVCAVFGVIAIMVPRVRRAGLVLFLAASIVYNGLFALEYLTGYYYGSAAQVTVALTSFIANDRSIPNVITYNDIGAYELIQSRKYGARFYPHDEFIQNNVGKFASSTGYYLVVQFPQLNQDAGYAKFFSECRSLDVVISKAVSGAVYDCKGVPTTLITGEHESRISSTATRKLEWHP